MSRTYFLTNSWSIRSSGFARFFDKTLSTAFAVPPSSFTFCIFCSASNFFLSKEPLNVARRLRRRLVSMILPDSSSDDDSIFAVFSTTERKARRSIKKNMTREATTVESARRDRAISNLYKKMTTTKKLDKNRHFNRHVVDNIL